jgi:hypothetical protein
MPYYVPVGPRGALLRFGTLLTTVFGSVTYWRATRRRALLPTNPVFTLNVPEL